MKLYIINMTKILKSRDMICSKAIKAIMDNRLYNPTTGVRDEITQFNLK